MFITFEGVEGCGKSTQSSLLKGALEKDGKSVILTREPGGTDIGVEIRNIILHSTIDFTHEYSELLLFYVDRLEHVKRVIEPALKEGKIVLCDRYIDSTIAYQVFGRGMSRDVVDRLSSIVNLTPDKTILFDLNVEEGIRRAKKRADLDRFEKEELAFHERVREGYLDQAQKHPHRMTKIDVDGKNIGDIHTDVKKILGLS
ncbi:dTMP kinase [Candidatus Marinamargulisbacteria bacterium SCGC AAA071-K20]|nr:dTMP kinase [Candidatus Marinamargulisbacteria bacterium SCGC AAA071-K20]